MAPRCTPALSALAWAAAGADPLDWPRQRPAPRARRWRAFQRVHAAAAGQPI